jgi:L-threonylcarbamoyladenylate synthase
MATLTTINSSVDQAAEALRQGSLVGVPTETVYGLAANALEPAAVARIFAAKRRPSFDPLIVHAPDLLSAQSLATEWPEAAKSLADAFWPGPLTLVLPKHPAIPDVVTAGLPTVGLRVPQHPLFRELLRSLDFPLAAPSANPFGFISPTRPEHVAAQLGRELAMILDGGPCEVGVESTIIGFPGGRPTLYRPGGVSLDDMAAVIGPIDQQTKTHSNPKAPGQLDRHYAPETPVRVLQDDTLAPEDYPNAVLLRFQALHPGVRTDRQYILAEDGRSDTAARNLFAALRELDAAGYSHIIAQPAPPEGLGGAINDRLKRAAAS